MLVIAISSRPCLIKSTARPLVNTLIPTFPATSQHQETPESENKNCIPIAYAVFPRKNLE